MPIKKRERLRGMPRIGEVLGLSADGARKRAKRDKRLGRLIEKDAVGWPCAWKDEIERYRDTPGRAGK
jgi:hypothetical protein